MVLVDDGTYLLSTNISIIIGITVESVNGYSSTIIDGNNATRCFFIDHTDALLDGFTIQNGYNPGGFGGGVNIDDGGSIVNCYITGNQARDGGVDQVRPLDHIDHGPRVRLPLCHRHDGIALVAHVGDTRRVLIGVQLLALSTQSFFVLNVALVFIWIAFAFVVIREHRRLSEMRG